MPLEKHEIKDLVNRYVAGKLTEAEVDVFLDAIEIEEVQEILARDIDARTENINYAGLLTEEKKQLLLERINNQRNNDYKPPVHRVHFLKTAWFKYAAAIIIVVTATYLWNNKKTENPPTTVAKTENQDILPGQDKAILTLSNGEKIELNNATSEIINDGTLTIKNKAGQLVYGSEPIPSNGGVAPGGANSHINPSSPGAGVGYNTMSTPNGGQYKLTLSDGTTAWLNAASSITYPVTFSGATREISVTGEIYLEVSQKKSQPFYVKLPDGSTIQVLGTSFNINTYPNEGAIRTTLLEGKIKVTKNNQQQLLCPNQQAIISEKITINPNIDPEQIIAWKNGVFNFKDADLPMVMRQLERWYDIDVQYAGKTNQQFRFRGELQRSLTLSQVLKVLERMEVKFKLEGKKLIVNP